MDKARFEELKRQVDEQEAKAADIYGFHFHSDNLNPLGSLTDQKELFARIEELETENERLHTTIKRLLEYAEMGFDIRTMNLDDPPPDDRPSGPGWFEWALGAPPDEDEED